MISVSILLCILLCTIGVWFGFFSTNKNDALWGILATSIGMGFGLAILSGGLFIAFLLMFIFVANDFCVSLFFRDEEAVREMATKTGKYLYQTITVWVGLSLFFVLMHFIWTTDFSHISGNLNINEMEFVTRVLWKYGFPITGLASIAICVVAVGSLFLYRKDRG